jgi:hypothetical protein
LLCSTITGQSAANKSINCCGFISTTVASSDNGGENWTLPVMPIAVPALLTGVDLPGGDSAPAIAAADASACAAECVANASYCGAWAFNGDTNMCALKKAAGVPVTACAACAAGARADIAPQAAVPLLFGGSSDPSRLDWGQLYPNSMLYDNVTGRLLIYASGARAPHGITGVNVSGIAVYSLRVDGFVGLTQDAAATLPGEVTTVGVTWGAGELYMSVDTSAPGAAAVVSVGDATGTEIPGYGYANAIPCTDEDAPLLFARWRSGKTMSQLSGRTVSVSVQLHGGAVLYALRGVFVRA